MLLVFLPANPCIPTNKYLSAHLVCQLPGGNEKDLGGSCSPGTYSLRGKTSPGTQCPPEGERKQHADPRGSDEGDGDTPVTLQGARGCATG